MCCCFDLLLCQSFFTVLDLSTFRQSRTGSFSWNIKIMKTYNKQLQYNGIKNDRYLMSKIYIATGTWNNKKMGIFTNFCVKKWYFHGTRDKMMDWGMKSKCFLQGFLCKYLHFICFVEHLWEKSTDTFLWDWKYNLLYTKNL